MNQAVIVTVDSNTLFMSSIFMLRLLNKLGCKTEIELSQYDFILRIRSLQDRINRSCI